MTPAATRHLTSARLELTSDARVRRLMRGILVAVLVALAAMAGLRFLTDGAAAGQQRNRLQRENAGLRTEVARLQAELAIERATHDALEQRVGALDQQATALESQLAFVNAQRTRGRGRAPTN